MYNGSTTGEPRINEYSIIVSSIGILIDPSLFHIMSLFTDIWIIIISLSKLCFIMFFVIMSFIQIVSPLRLFELVSIPNVISIGSS